jgi:hypothetical protein
MCAVPEPCNLRHGTLSAQHNNTANARQQHQKQHTVHSAHRSHTQKERSAYMYVLCATCSGEVTPTCRTCAWGPQLSCKPRTRALQRQLELMPCKALAKTKPAGPPCQRNSLVTLIRCVPSASATPTKPHHQHPQTPRQLAQLLRTGRCVPVSGHRVAQQHQHAKARTSASKRCHSPL